MTFSFQDLQQHVLENAHLSPDFFGQLITYKRVGESDASIYAVIKHQQRLEESDHGHQVVFEQIVATLLKSDFDSPPKLKDRILLAGESDAYVFAYRNEADAVTYVATFERRTLPVVNSR